MTISEQFQLGLSCSPTMQGWDDNHKSMIRMIFQELDYSDGVSFIIKSRNNTSRLQNIRIASFSDFMEVYRLVSFSIPVPL